MTGHTELVPFFEREEGSLEGFPVESYMAGFRLADGEPVVEMKLPADGCRARCPYGGTPIVVAVP
jgi:hypothetical protein